MESHSENENIYDIWHNISDETVSEWLSEENLNKKTRRIFQGFEIIDSLDDRVDNNIEISLVKITEKGLYPQHVHQNSDAYFIIIDGQAIFLSGENRKNISKGEKIDVPRGMPHGFELEEGCFLEFISIQSPPIKDSDTGEEDFHLIEKI